MITEDEYKKFTKSISNEEVPSLLFNVLSLIHSHLERKDAELNDTEQLSYSMFKLFFKQYNTILTLSKGLKYIYSPSSEYIDLKSIYTLIRTSHELYLTYNYLFYPKSFSDFDKILEQEFKILTYKLSGEIENKKTAELVNSFGVQNSLCVESIAGIESRKADLLAKIYNHQIYRSLPKHLKNAIKSGAWKINTEKKLSWSDLLENTPMSKRYGISEYHNMSKYAHTAYSSLQLEAQHDYNMVNLLYHLYVIASLFSISALEVNGKNIDFIPKREQSLVLEFYHMANL